MFIAFVLETVGRRLIAQSRQIVAKSGRVLNLGGMGRRGAWNHPALGIPVLNSLDRLFGGVDKTKQFQIIV